MRKFTGIICTVITIYLLFISEYFGDMMMNFYYSVMSIYGWWNWSRKKNDKYVVPISRTTTKEKWIGFENALNNNAKINPDDLASYYIQLTNDLSYAQTYYPDSKTLLYLNSLASQQTRKK